jgi:uncharacterized YigZ family protein
MNQLPDKIKTLSNQAEFELKEKGSSFISISAPIENENSAIEFLNSIRKKYYDATHHCYSYKLLDGKFKYSDDGEPNGTAGIRIFNAQNHFEVTNLITVVTRYFGGIKLGVGPLGKAYYEAAYTNLNQSQINEKNLFYEINIKFEFKNSKTTHHLISKHGLKIIQNTFEDQPCITCLLPSTSFANFESEVAAQYNTLLVTRTGKIQFI